MQIWTHWDLNPGPSACEADVIPLHHEPDTFFSEFRTHEDRLSEIIDEKSLSHTGLEPVTFGT